MGWFLDKTTGVLTQFKVNQRIKPTQSSHSNRFILVTTSRFVNVFLVDGVRDQGSSSRLKHLLSISCYDVISMAQMVCPIGDSDEKFRIILATRGGDILTTMHPALDVRPKKRKGDRMEEEQGDGNPILIRVQVEDRLYSCEGDIIGLRAISTALNFAICVAEKNCDGTVKIVWGGGGGGAVAVTGCENKPSLMSSVSVPSLVYAKTDNVSIHVVIPQAATAVARSRASFCHSCVDLVPSSTYEAILKMTRNKEASAVVETSSFLLLFAFNSGQVFSARFDLSSIRMSPLEFLVDFQHSIIHFAVLTGDLKTNASQGFLLGVSQSGTATTLALNERTEFALSNLALPDTPKIASSSDRDLLFSTGSFFYEIDCAVLQDPAVSARSVCSSRLFAHSNILSFSLIHDSELTRVPDLLFFLDGRGNFFYRRLSVRGSNSSETEKDDFQQMSNFISRADDLTQGKFSYSEKNKALNDVLKNLVVCGHLRKLEGGGGLLGVDTKFERREDGDRVQVNLILTLTNYSVDFSFGEGWNWNIGKERC